MCGTVWPQIQRRNSYFGCLFRVSYFRVLFLVMGTRVGMSGNKSRPQLPSMGEYGCYVASPRLVVNIWVSRSGLRFDLGEGYKYLRGFGDLNI